MLHFIAKRFCAAAAVLAFIAASTSPVRGQGIITPVQMNVPGGNFACGAQNVPVLAVSLTGGAGVTDTLYFDQISQGAGTAGPADSPMMKVWYQPVAGPFNLAQDTVIASIASAGTSWDSTNPGGSLGGAMYLFPVTVGSAIYFTVDLNAGSCGTSTIGRFFQPSFPQYNGLVVSTYDFPSSAPVTSSIVQTIVGSSPGSFPLVNQPGGFVPPGTPGLTILEIQVGAVSGAMPLASVTIQNSGTALASDFSAMRLWAQPAAAGLALDPSQAVYVANLSTAGPRLWQAPIPNWNFQNGDCLIVTADVLNSSTLNRTLQFGLPVNGVQPTGGIPLPSTAETNSNVVTIAYPTPTPTVTPTPTITASPTPTFQASGMNQTVVAPVPAHAGDRVCLYFDKPAISSSWDVFNMAGERVSQLTFTGDNGNCWDTRGAPPGVYLMRIRVNYADGTSAQVMKKEVLAP